MLQLHLIISVFITLYLVISCRTESKCSFVRIFWKFKRSWIDRYPYETLNSLSTIIQNMQKDLQSTNTKIGKCFGCFRRISDVAFDQKPFPNAYYPNSLRLFLTCPPLENEEIILWRVEWRFTSHNWSKKKKIKTRTTGFFWLLAVRSRLMQRSVGHSVRTLCLHELPLLSPSLYGLSIHPWSAATVPLSTLLIWGCSDRFIRSEEDQSFRGDR